MSGPRPAPGAGRRAPPWLAGVAERLGREIGLRVDGATEARVVQAVETLARAAGLEPAAYAASLDDPAERQRLVDAFSVPETAFFRDPAQFRVLATHVLPALDGPVVVWSAGCSTGQEAYSLAMTLDDAAAGPWTVLATDVSTPALDRARGARYRPEDLRGLPAGYRSRYLRRDGPAWVVDDALRRRVTVARHNLARDEIPVAPGGCQVVFCRNVLIYFRPDRARALLDRLYEAILPGGWLFVGASEPLWPVTDRFEPVRFGDVFAYRRPAERAPRRPPADRSARRGLVASAARAAPGLSRRPGAGGRSAQLLRDGEAAHRRGDLAAAAAHFRQAASVEPDNALVHVRLGLVLDAQGDTEGGRRAFLAARSALSRGHHPGVEAGLEGWQPDELARLLARKLGEQ